MNTHLSFLGGLLFAMHVHGAEAAKAPNLLYIFPDQYRLHALSLWSDPAYKSYLSTLGDPVYTPNLDSLAKEGICFTQASSTYPLSSPHRAMLMTGMFSQSNGVMTNCALGREAGLKQDIVCLTDVLAQAGYQTAYCGKVHWHKTEALFDKNGSYVGTTSAPGGHAEVAFDTYVPPGPSRHSNAFWYQQLLDNHHHAIAYSNRPETIEGLKDGQKFQTNEFSTHREADVLIKYLENKGGERAAGKPFSIIWSINPPHTPYQSVKDCDEDVYNQYYKDMSPEDLFVRKNVDRSNEILLNKRAENARVYFSLIKSVDEEIGRVLKTLEDVGEKDNTIIVFTSDHGEMMFSHHQMAKNIYYDESFLVPYIIHYPKMLQARMEDLLMGSVDIMPTILGLLGLSDKIPASVQGVNYSSALMEGDFSVIAKPLSAYYIGPASRGVRTDRYTYVVKQNGDYELYDNKQDPYQQSSLLLSDVEEGQAELLKTQLGMWLQRSKDEWYVDRWHPHIISY